MAANRKRLTFVVLLLALALSLAAPVGATMQFPSRFVPGDDAIGPAAGDQSAPAAIAGADIFLAVWADKRSIPSGAVWWFDFETSSDIYAVRLDVAGNPLEPVPFPITAGPGSQENPQVVWNGTNWLVVYESYAIGGTGYYYEKSLEAVRVSPAGLLLDPTPIRIYGVIPTAGMWSVASDGNNWVVAFEGSSASYDLMALRISPAGVVLDPPIHTLVPATYYTRYNLRLAYAAGVFLLTWADFSDTMAIRFNQDLDVLDPAPLPLVTGYNLSGLTSNGSQFYAVWIAQPDVPIIVAGSRISTEGVMLDGSGVDISQANQPEPYTTPSVVWDGTNWKVTWAYQGVSVARVDVNGQVLDPGGIPIAGLGNGPTAPSPSGGLEIVWTIFDISLANSYDVEAAAISVGNVAGPIQALSAGAPMQVLPDAAVGSAGYMVVYRSDISGVKRVMAQPLDAAGDPLTVAPLQLDAGDSTYGPGAPAVAWNGALYLAVWTNSSGVVAQRILQDGTLVDAAPFVVMPGFGPADVAALGDVFLVTGLQIVSNPQYVIPGAARVRGTDGVVLDPTPLILGNSFVSAQSVTVLGGRWLVVWESHPTHDNPIANTMATFVSADGTFIPEFFVYGSYTTGSYSYGPSVAASGSVALVVQNAEISSGVEMDLVGRIVNSDGSLQPAITLTPWAGNQYRPRVAWDGSYFVIVYQDQRNRLTVWELDQLDARSDLFGMRVGADGAILDPRGFLFSNSAQAEAYPSVAAANGLSLIAAALLRNAPYAAYRVGYEQLGVGGNAWPVAVASASPDGGDVPLTVAFSSAGSTDPDGSIVAYSWDFGDGSTSSAANPTHVYTTGGPFVAMLTVTDNQGAQTSNLVLVQAMNPNQLPVAHASAEPTSGPAPLSVIFYASGSYDPDGSLGNFHWAFGDGSEYWGTVAYNTFSNPGTYVTTLTVYDNRNGTGTATITITVGGPNNAPVLSPIGNKSVDELVTLVFTATATDPDPNQTLTFSLDAGAPPGASIDPGTGVFSWTPTEQQGPGNYPVTVRVADDGNPALNDWETIHITVREVNRAPVLSPIGDKSVDELATLVFTATATDPDPNQPRTFSLDAGAPTGASIGPVAGVFSWTPTEQQGPGYYTVTVRVTDNGNPALSDWETLHITVHEVNQAPIVDAGADQEVAEGQPVQFSGSFINPGRLPHAPGAASIHWSFGDGATATGLLTPTHAYGEDGVFTVTLTVTDTLGGVGQDALLVTVTNQAPILAPLPDQAIRIGQVVTVTGTFTDAGWLDAHTVTVEWAPGLTATLSLAAGASEFGFEHLYANPGVYTVSVTIADLDGGRDSRSFTVTVAEYRIFLPSIVRP
jgi:PKD repeat protein